MVTFTLPAQFRSLAWQQQRVMYDLITAARGRPSTLSAGMTGSCAAPRVL